MKKVEAVIRPEKLTDTIKRLKEMGITALTVSQVVGRGLQKDEIGVYRGQNYKVSLHPKVKLEIVLSDHMIDPTIKAITEAAQTGEPGDGKIYVYPILEAYNIRTGQPDETIDDLMKQEEVKTWN